MYTHMCIYMYIMYIRIFVRHVTANHRLDGRCVSLYTSTSVYH